MAAVWLCGSNPAWPADGGWQSIFDGRTLDGWDVHDARYWSVEQGAIVGRITPENPCTVNQYLVWKGGELADFELRLRSRLRGQGAINNGFQFRSRVLPDHDVCGYQMDNNLETPWLVRLYDEYGRHTLAMRGERTVFDPDGRRTTTAIDAAQGPAWFRLEDWHEYHLTCVGPRLTLRVDGRLAAEVEDHDRQSQDLQGVLALQLHSGPPTVVEFRDIQLRVLKPAEPRPVPVPTAIDRRRDALRQSALAWWPLDTGGHGATPRLRHVPEWDRFDLNALAIGPGARPDARVVLLDGAHFEGGPDLHLEGEALTVFLRARDPRGTWNAALFGKRSVQGDIHFNLYADDLPGTPGPDFIFEVGTESGTARVHFPVSTLAADAWLDLVGRYDGRELTLFAQGTPRATANHPGALRRHEGPVWIGAERDPAGAAVRHFRGALEIAAVWARALSDAEIRTLSGLP